MTTLLPGGAGLRGTMLKKLERLINHDDVFHARMLLCVAAIGALCAVWGFTVVPMCRYGEAECFFEVNVCLRPAKFE